MKQLPLDTAIFASLWVETFLNGLFTVLFSICVWVLLYSKRRARKQVNKPLLIAAIVTYTLSTGHVITDFVRGVVAFINYKDNAEGALGYLAQLWTWSNVFREAIYVTNNVVADSLVVYRCYVVWGNSIKIIIVPVIMLLGSTICGYAAVYGFSTVTPGEDVFVSAIADWGTALFSISLSTNITVTSLIAGRIWWVSRQTSQVLGAKHSRKYSQALEIVIESGAIFAVTQLILLVLYVLRHNAQYIVFDSMAQIMGIVPTLIIVRIGLGMSAEAHTNYGTTLNKISFSSAEARRPHPVRVNKTVEITDDQREVDLDEFETRTSGTKVGQDYYMPKRGQQSLSEV
ncbi:hypothetical protein D9758_008937 [Tetrapyrgos nigripes]|uniref:Uncharacterized protein n=1 Tax=Tetrapyrgos nigripes TaxID=182062 RepID=A0A8H5GKB3_9AGAR|nr:hypothetical protein D9758_008937 [Tetrapyrgos nigripes]